MCYNEKRNKKVSDFLFAAFVFSLIRYMACLLYTSIANTVCADDRDDVTYLSFNDVEGDRAIMDVTLFVKRFDGLFERRDETHIQYIYEESEICAALSDCGFQLVGAEGHLGLSLIHIFLRYSLGSRKKDRDDGRKGTRKTLSFRHEKGTQRHHLAGRTDRADSRRRQYFPVIGLSLIHI